MSMALESTLEKQCPECLKSISYTKGYVVWCEHCNWNLNADSFLIKPSNVFEKAYLATGKKLGLNMLHSFIELKHPVSQLSISKICTIVLALCVHLLSIGAFGAGVYLCIKSYPNWVMMSLSFLFVLFAWAAKPQFNKIKESPLSREQFPVLYKVFDEIAVGMNASKVDGVIINEEYNASFSQIGWKRKRIVHIGLPLLKALNKQEFVALAAHELAHGINGDLNRGIFVGTAINTLNAWHELLRPFDTRYGLAGIFMIVPNCILWLASKVISLWIYTLCHLNWHDSQRAEYLADRYAAETAGKTFKLSMLQKLHLHELFQFAVLKVINTKQGGHFFEVLQDYFRHIPDKELDRIARIKSAVDSRLDATHPPTSYRIDYITSLDESQTTYELNEGTYNAMMMELDKLKAPIENTLLTKYRIWVLE